MLHHHTIFVDCYRKENKEFDKNFMKITILTVSVRSSWFKLSNKLRNFAMLLFRSVLSNICVSSLSKANRIMLTTVLFCSSLI